MENPLQLENIATYPQYRKRPGRQNGRAVFTMLNDVPSETPADSGLSVTVKHGARKPFCRAGSPTERDLRKSAQQSHSFVRQGVKWWGISCFAPHFAG